MVPKDHFENARGPVTLTHDECMELAKYISYQTQRIAALEAKAAVVDLLNKATPGPTLMSMSGDIRIEFNGAYEDSKAAYDALIAARTLLQEPRA